MQMNSGLILVLVFFSLSHISSQESITSLAELLRPVSNLRNKSSTIGAPLACKNSVKSVCQTMCLNGGKCSPMTNCGFRCKCTQEFKGYFCEKKTIGFTTVSLDISFKIQQSLLKPKIAT